MPLEVLKRETLASLQPVVSVVIPLLNEAENVLSLYERLRMSMNKEIGHGRSSLSMMAAPMPPLNCWKSCISRPTTCACSGCGATSARRQRWPLDLMRRGGARIVSLDADLQNDPQDIARLLKKFDEGYDAVSGWRIHRQESFWLRRLPSRLANWLISPRRREFTSMIMAAAR
jgi:Glycosyl transferase family 2